MNFRSITKIKNRFAGLMLLLLVTALLSGCENDPGSLGITFVSANDTLSARTLDSQLDTMPITNNNYLKFINTSNSPNILVGNYQNYTSHPLLRFRNINTDLDSAVIVNATLTLRYNNYYFQDENGLTSFNIYRMNTKFNYSTITYDSVNSSDYDNVSQGSYSGTPEDTQLVNITLNNQLAKDWLEYAADTAYSVKNNGVILLPNAGSNTIKGFYSANNSFDIVPYVTIIYTKNSTLDTTVLNISDYVTLSDAPYSIIPPNRFVLQSGVAYRNVLNFDLTKLPPNVIINNVTLTFTLDNSVSFISPTTDKRVVIGEVIDSATKADSIFVNAFLADSISYSLSSTTLNSIFQRWNSGVLPNLGISMKNYFETQNLDYFVFYSPTATEVSFRPRIKITYTLRN